MHRLDSERAHLQMRLGPSGARGTPKHYQPLPVKSKQTGRAYLLVPLRQRQDRSLALHVRAIEEAHAEQGDGQAVALRDDCVDIMHGHAANAYRVELETISEHIAVGRFHRDLLAVVVVA